MFPKNHILHMKGHVPKIDCNRVIDYFESHSELQFEGYSGYHIDYKLKKDTEILCDLEKCDGVYWISKYVHEAASEYIKNFPSSGLLTNGIYITFLKFKDIIRMKDISIFILKIQDS